MKIPKMSPLEWLRLILAVYSPIKVIAKAIGSGIVDTIRVVVDLMARMEDMFPEDGHGSDKLKELTRILVSSVLTEGEAWTLEAAEMVAPIEEAATGIKERLRALGFFQKAIPKPK